MKKLITLLVILGLVNIASANVVDLVISSLNEQPIDPVKEITIGPSDTVNMDIVYEGDTGTYLFSMSLDVIAEGPGALDITAPTYPDGIWDAALTEIIPPTGISGAAAFFGAPAGTIAVDHLLLHCTDRGDVVVYLQENPDYPSGGTLVVDENFNMLDFSFGPGVVIHQIPEPMTLALLGLGGLFLRRRK